MDRFERIDISDCERGRGIPKKNYNEVIRRDTRHLRLTEDKAQVMGFWRPKIRLGRFQIVFASFSLFLAPYFTLMLFGFYNML